MEAMQVGGKLRRIDDGRVGSTSLKDAQGHERSFTHPPTSNGAHGTRSAALSKLRNVLSPGDIHIKSLTPV